MDGTTNHSGKVTHCVNLLIKQGGNNTIQQFYCSNLGKDQLILGFPWLEETNLDIDWRERKVKGALLIINPTTREGPDDKKHLLHCTRMCAQQATTAGKFDQGDKIVMRVWCTNIAQEWAIQEN